MEQIKNLALNYNDTGYSYREQTENLKLKVQNRYKILAHDKLKYQN